MSALKRLQEADSLTDFAKLLGYTPKGLSFVLYKQDDSKKYDTFKIPKKAGGFREIKAPEPRLRTLQLRLSDLLNQCVAENKRYNPNYWRASHGFHKGRTIVSNAEVHRRRRFVFNLDLEDFFGTINFGRVRGFFIADRSFALPPNIATLIAQIACHENALPQGSPCSPVVSNLLGNILDLRLIGLARDARCSYTRYADDLTFSTNEMLFPQQVAVNTQGAEWEVGPDLRSEIEKAGFKINGKKTRMSLRRSRQTVTGLVVNGKPNISIDYYRYVRAMCNSLFRNGEYRRPHEGETETLADPAPLEGMLAHLYFVKSRRDRPPRINKLARAAGEFNPPRAPIELYRKFLFYKYFAAPKAPLVVTEGVSDINYLQCAIRSLASSFPSLAKVDGSKVTRLVNFLRPSGTTRDVINLGHGASGQAALIAQYSSLLRKYKHKPMEHPVIILCDNDDGPKTVFKNAKNCSGTTVSMTTADPFYHICDNLYLVKVPEGTPPKNAEIEDLFLPTLLTTLVEGKPFDRKKEHEDETAYGKVVFSEKVVRANWSTIDFSGFAELLSRMVQCQTHYSTIAKPTDTKSTSASASK